MINSMNTFIKKFNEEKETGIERRGRRKKFVLNEWYFIDSFWNICDNVREDGTLIKYQ